MPEVTRVNGSAQPGSWYGLAPRYFKVDTGNVTVATNYTNTGSNFEKAVFAVSSLASIVTLGTPSGNAFVVAVDNTFGGSGTANATSALESVIADALPTANAIVVTESTGFVGGAFDTFA
jgi:hypothetical protein